MLEEDQVVCQDAYSMNEADEVILYNLWYL